MTALFDRLVQASLEGSRAHRRRLAGVPPCAGAARVVSRRAVVAATLKLPVGLAGIDPISLPILPPVTLLLYPVAADRGWPS